MPPGAASTTPPQPTPNSTHATSPSPPRRSCPAWRIDGDLRPGRSTSTARHPRRHHPQRPRRNRARPPPRRQLPQHRRSAHRQRPINLGHTETALTRPSDTPSDAVPRSCSSAGRWGCHRSPTSRTGCGTVGDLALVLDSPVLDWAEVIKANCVRADCPQQPGISIPWLTAPLARAVGLPHPARSFDWSTRAADFSTPILISTAPETTPCRSGSHKHPRRPPRSVELRPSTPANPLLERRSRPMAERSVHLAQEARPDLIGRTERPPSHPSARLRPRNPTCRTAGIIASGRLGHGAREDQRG